MIDVRELRIGNYFHSSNGAIETITGRILQHLDEGTTPRHLWPKPIHITEEILLRCGFEKLGKIGFIATYRHKTIEDLWFKDISISSGIFIYKSLEVECEGLHYLQNLTYFNAQKELELN